MEPFGSDFDLERYLYRSRDWVKSQQKRENDWGYKKRFGGVWFEISGTHLGFNTEVNIGPTVGETPRPPDDDYDRDWFRQYREDTSAWMNVRGKTYEDVEDVIVNELLPAHQRYAEPVRQQKRVARREQRATTRWGGYEGQEAIDAWRERVEELVLERFDDDARHFLRTREHGREYGYQPKRRFWTTGDLFRFFVEDEAGHDIEWPSGFDTRWAKRAFKTVLVNLAKQGKILSGNEWGERGKWTFEEERVE